jgi:hypothetical protein
VSGPLRTAVRHEQRRGNVSATMEKRSTLFITVFFDCLNDCAVWCIGAVFPRRRFKLQLATRLHGESNRGQQILTADNSFLSVAAVFERLRQPADGGMISFESSVTI